MVLVNRERNQKLLHRVSLISWLKKRTLGFPATYAVVGMTVKELFKMTVLVVIF
jgi:hypothetical protein